MIPNGTANLSSFAVTQSTRLRTIPSNDAELPVSMLVQLLEQGKALHGDALSIYLENYPHPDWKKRQLPSAGVTEEIQSSGYSDILGLSPLRSALADRDAAKRSLPFLSGDNVAVTQGGTHAIHSILQAFGRPNSESEVLVPAPSYTGYRDMCKLLKLKHRPYRMDAGREWLTENLLKSLRPSSIVIVNTPHNPSGAQIQTDQLIRLCWAARKSGSVVLFDCVYDDLVYEGDEPEWSAAFRGPSDLGSFIWVNSFSKNYGLPGLRLGWITGGTATIKRLEAVIESSILCLPSFSQRMGIAALNMLSGALAPEMRERRDHLCKRLAEIPGLEFSSPSAGITIMARLRKETGMDLVQRLLRTHAVVLLPGEAYYHGDPQTIRLSFGYSISDIDKYTALLECALSSSAAHA